MARASSGGFSQHQYSDGATRERGDLGSTSRADKLLGYSSLAYTSVHDTDTDGLSELNEADVWDLGGEGSPEDLLGRNDVSAYDGMGGNRADSSDPYRFMNTGRRWLGIEKEPGLSVAFADSSRAYGLSALSPHKLVGYGNYSGQSASRDAAARGISTAARMIPPIVQLRENSARPMMHQSAPVNVPDWSKILGAEKKSKWADDDLDSDKEDAEEERLPPHLQIARQSQMTTFSVCEGAGRTLKGRDLSRVRNAVLRQTGFLDS